MNFRRVVVVLAALALFTSLASAAIPIATTLTCQMSADNPTIRTEGKTEQVGDLKLSCTGGPTPVGNGNDIGFVNIVVDYGVPVTSGSEAMLAVDEPTTPTPFILCTAATNNAAALPGNPPTANCGVGATAGAGVLDATVPNIYQGVGPSLLKPNQVSFNNIPVQALAANTMHVFRIVNVRVTPSGVSPVVPSVTITAVTNSLISLATTGSNPTVATPAAGLITTVTAPGLSTCSGANLSGATGSPNMAMLTFKEGFASAFKPQAVPNVPAGANAAQTNITGSVSLGTPAVTYTKYTSEGGWQGVAGTGVASSPTRLQALFTGLDANAQYYVSVNNVDAFNAVGTVKATLLTQTSPGMTTQAAGNVVTAPVGGFTTANGTVPVWPLTVSATGTAQAVWEIASIDPTAIETLNFAVYAVFNTTTPPTPSAAQTIQLGFAPTATATGAASTWIPRFSSLPTAVTGAPILKCQTSLMFPFVTNQGGFETGIAISNTGSDPFHTAGSTGDCTLNLYGTNAPTAAVSFATAMAPGAVVTNTASGLGLVNFNGYGVAVCTFQYAHGFAFIEDGTRSMAMGYLALVMQGGGRGQSLLGENLGQ